MAETAINGQNWQIVNKNSNEMAKGPFWKVYLVNLAEMAIYRQIVNNVLNKMAKGPFWKKKI